MNILHDFKALTACAFALLVASCSEEQTSLDVNSFPGKAQIIGSLAYSEGTVLENGQFKELIKPAADKEVCLEISNSAYKTGAAGVTTWKVRTDAQGKFEATLPVPSSSTTVTIKPADFTGYFYSVARENNEYVADTAFVVYRLNSAANTKSVSANQITFADLMYSNVEEQELTEGYTEYATLTGRIGMNKTRYYAAVTAPNPLTQEPMLVSAPAIKSYFDNAPSVSLLIKATYNGYTRNYNCTTNTNGMFSVDIPVKEYPCDITYEIDALPFTATYTDYEQVEKKWAADETALYTYDYEAVAKEGFYAPAANVGSGTASYAIKGQPCEIEAKMMIFFPYEGTAPACNATDPWIEELDKEEETTL